MANGRHSYVAFYPSDWMAGTARMPRLYRSVYFDICCYIWDTAKPVPLRELLLMIADLPKGMAIVDDLVAMGKVDRLDDGSIVNAKALAEAEKSFTAWEKMSEAGKGRHKPVAKGVKKGAGSGASKGVSSGQQENQNQNHISPSGDKKPPDHAAPEGVSEETWQGFLEVRRKKRAPITDKAYGMILKALTESNSSPDDTIARSVMNGWTGVFPIEGRGNGRIDRPSAWRG